MGSSHFSRIAGCLSTAVPVLLLVVVPGGTFAQAATGRFEIYCDGAGFFLEKVDGAPAPRKLLLFLYTGFPVSRMCQRKSGKTSMSMAMGVPPTESAKSSHRERFG